MESVGSVGWMVFRSWGKLLDDLNLAVELENNVGPVLGHLPELDRESARLCEVHV
jgi:hypothetical protein